MRSDSIYASLLAKVPLRSQVNLTLDDLKQKYQQLITAKKWGGVGHVGMDNHNKSAFNATANPDNEAQSYATYVNNKALFSGSTNGPSFKPAIILGIKDTFAQTAGSFLLRRQMVLLPLRARSA